MTDTHAHLYMEAFEEDLEEVIGRALKRGVNRMFLPNLDSSSIGRMSRLCRQYKGTCFPMMGLHPTSVKENYREELEIIGAALRKGSYIAVGEIGIDLYWDKTFLSEQQDAFRTQLEWAIEVGLPVVIHARESFREIFDIMDEMANANLTGVFHSFTGNSEQVKKALSYGFFIGINGIVTFKNSGLDSVAQEIPLERLLLETDAPFLAPVPHRGKRNESAYVTEIAAKIAGIHDTDLAEIAKITTQNARKLFKKAF